MPVPSFDDVEKAAARLRSQVHHTPVLTCQSLDRLSGARLFFKCENLQKVGAFKFRGASNAVLSLPEAAVRKGVATHSSGNHAAALALAARLRGVKSFIVMPRNAPAIKKAAVAGYGAEIVFCEPTLEAREAALSQVAARTGAVFVHPYNDPLVISGQGTAALELLNEIDDLDAVLAPVGGGGLMSGTALAAAGASPKTRVIAAEPEMADDAFRSLKEGRIVPSVNPKTIADGLRTQLGELTFALISAHVAEIITVSEAAIVQAMRLVWERMKLVIEPSAAVPLAAVVKRKEDFQSQRVGIILSGGNADLDHLPWAAGGEAAFQA